MPLPPVPPDSKICYRPKEFAELVGLGLSTTFKRIREGRLRAVSDGRNTTLILRKDAEAYLNSLPSARAEPPK